MNKCNECPQKHECKETEGVRGWQCYDGDELVAITTEPISQCILRIIKNEKTN